MIGCIVQARMGSSRLSGKVMMMVDPNLHVIDYVLNQLKATKLIDEIIVATSTQKQDEKIINHLKLINAKFFRGSESDVLDRYYQCAKKFLLSSIVRVTADNPLIDPKIVDDVIRVYKTKNYDYVTNSYPRTFPYGTEVEVFSFKSLEIAWKNAELPSEREHVTPYIKNNQEIFKIFNFESKKNLSHLRWTVDTSNDLKLVSKIAGKIKTRPIFMKDILQLFKSNPELVKINADFIPDEGYLKSLEDDKKFLKYKNL